MKRRGTPRRTELRVLRETPVGSRGPRTVQCLECARCCTYVAIGVNAPKTPRLATDILWHLYHENVSVFVDEDQEWYVQFETRCRNLLPDNRCAIYEHRPVICRVYEETSCEVNQTRPNTITFREPDEFLKYLGLVNPKLLARIERQYVPLKRPTVASEQSR